MSGQRIKYQYRVIDQRAGHDQPPLMAVSIHHGVVRRDTLTDDLPRAADLSNYKLCKPGDIVLNRMRAFQGAIGISPERGLVSPDYLVLRPGPGVDPRYLHHLFRSTWFVGEMVSRLRGIGNTENGAVRTPRINPDDLGEISVNFPPVDEQRRIADFLDTETTRIDKLRELQVAARKAVQARLMATLDIEIDELGKIHGIRQFRRSIRLIEQGVSPQCDNFAANSDEWGVLKVSSIKGGAFHERENKRLPEGVEPERRYEVKHGDLLITRANTPQLVGAATVAKHPRQKLLLCDKIFRVATTVDLLPEFLVYASMTKKVRDMCAEASHGTSQSMANLKTEEIKRWPVPMAPVSVQRQAVAQFTKVRNDTINLTDAIDRQLVLFAERRQALIAAAVTGQIDVTTARGLSEVDGVKV